MLRYRGTLKGLIWEHSENGAGNCDECEKPKHTPVQQDGQRQQAEHMIDISFKTSHCKILL